MPHTLLTQLNANVLSAATPGWPTFAEYNLGGTILREWNVSEYNLATYCDDESRQQVLGQRTLEREARGGVPLLDCGGGELHSARASRKWAGGQAICFERQ